MDIVNGDSYSTNFLDKNFGETSLKLTVQIIDNTKNIIISAIIDSLFKIIHIDLKNNNNQIIHTIYNNNTNLPSISSLNSAGISKTNIQCDSLNDQNFYCSFYYSNGNLFGINGNFTNKDDKDIFENICKKDCFNGNVATIGKDKYLFCYQKKIGDFSDLISIYCRYYSYTSGRIILLSENKVSSSLYKYKLNPLIIYNFKYSIIIEVDYETDGFDSSFIIISTLNLGLQLEFVIEQVVDNNNNNDEL